MNKFVVVLLIVLPIASFVLGGVLFDVFIGPSGENVYFTPDRCSSMPCTQYIKIGISGDDEVVTSAVIEVASAGAVSLGESWERGPMSCYNNPSHPDYKTLYSYAGGRDDCGTNKYAAQVHCNTKGYQFLGSQQGQYYDYYSDGSRVPDSLRGNFCVRHPVSEISNVIIANEAAFQPPNVFKGDVAKYINAVCNDCDEAKIPITSSSYGTARVKLISWSSEYQACRNCAPETISSKPVVICAAGELAIDGLKIQRCSQDGTFWELAKTCVADETPKILNNSPQCVGLSSDSVSSDAPVAEDTSSQTDIDEPTDSTTVEENVDVVQEKNVLQKFVDWFLSLFSWIKW